MRRVSVTPTWEGILPALLSMIKDGTLEAQAAAQTELKRMAQLADLYIKEQQK